MNKSLITTLAAAAFVAAPISLFTVPQANAVPYCSDLDPAMTAQCLAAIARIPNLPAAPAAPGGPCIPSPGLNQNCGEQSNQPGLCMLTGVCQPKAPLPPGSG
jgi:hypothetical protein